MKIPTNLVPKYAYQRIKHAKWNVTPDLLMEPRLMARICPGMDKQEHARRVPILTALCIRYHDAWATHCQRCHMQYGNGGTYYGHAGWDSWPISARDEARRLIIAAQDARELALAHHLATGKRKSTFQRPTIGLNVQ